MAVEDYLESEVAIAVAATVAVMSPRFRRVLRRGAVYGVAGALKATDVVSAAARGVAHGLGPQATPAGPGDGQAHAAQSPHAPSGA
jgi:hypothetical protein